MFVLNVYNYFCIFCIIALEPFPISSSTHVQYLKKNFCSPLNYTLIENVEHLLHGCILIIIAFIFFNRWFFLLKNFRRASNIILKIFFLGFITELATLIGFLFLSGIKNNFSVGFGFFITSFLLFSQAILKNHTNNGWNKKNALIIGLAQAFAFLPGISRFAVTFCITRLMGLSAKKSLELSFLIEAPILFVICAKGLNELYNSQQLVFVITPLALTTIFIAMVFMYYALIFMRTLIDKERFWLFGYYTLALCILSWLY